jgi:hypothetical protein
MNPGNAVRETELSCAVTAQDDNLAAALDTERASAARPSLQTVQDIQELIDKLAAVNRQLGYPDHS